MPRQKSRIERPGSEPTAALYWALAQITLREYLGIEVQFPEQTSLERTRR